MLGAQRLLFHADKMYEMYEKKQQPHGSVHHYLPTARDWTRECVFVHFIFLSHPKSHIFGMGFVFFFAIKPKR